MFNNIGGKIKVLAKIITFIGIISSVFWGLYIMSLDEKAFYTGMLIIVIGCLASWISSFLLYGYGHLIQNSDKVAEALSILVEETTDYYK